VRTPTTRNILTYAALIPVGVALLFPFYWVLSSSVKSREAISATPPEFYPAKTATSRLAYSADGRTFATASDTAFLLLPSEDLLGSRDDDGGYFLRLDGAEPTQFVSWRGFDSVRRVPPPSDSIVFADAPTHVLLASEREVRVIARMARQSDDRYEEILFVERAGGGNPEMLRNVEHEPKRVFHARWENYEETLAGPEASYGEKSIGFLRYLWNSFFVAALAVIGEILSASLVAYGFARLRFKGRELLFTLVLATLMVPAQVTLVPLFGIYKSLGWLDTFLPLIVPHFTAGAFNVFLLRQYMLGLPRELDESAAIDGCGVLRTYWSVVLPNCVPALIVAGLFTFVGTWQDVMGPLIYLDSPELRTVPLGLEYFRSPYVDNRHLLMTGATLSMLPVAILFVIFQRYIMGGVATTGLKG
jgi:multiple sugar transport system permease protein